MIVMTTAAAARENDRVLAARGRTTSSSFPRATKIASIVVATSVVAIVSVVVAARAVAILPSRLDGYLTTGDHFCRPDAYARGSYAAGWSSRWERYRQGHVMGGGGGDDEGAHRGGDGGGVVGRVSNYMLHRISSRIWTMISNGDGDPDDDRIGYDDGVAMTIPGGGPPTSGGGDDDDVVVAMHPMCGMYRDLRRRLRFRVACIPWNWYVATNVRVYGLALRGTTSSTTMTSDDYEDDDNGYECECGDDGPGSASPMSWTMGWIGIRGDERGKGKGGGGDTRGDDPSRPTPDDNVEDDDDESCRLRDSLWIHRSSLLPPSIRIETTYITIRSAWSRPIVSVNMSGIALSVVVRGSGLGGGFFPSLVVDPHGIVDGTSLLVGDMALREFVDILPRPPETEGTYPRIGSVNITNVTFRVYEYDGTGGGEDDDDGSRASLRLLFQIRVPDEFFVPITELTLAHEPDGIDRKHFQPMVESSISVALRRHLSREAAAALRDSWGVTAHMAHEQLQRLILHAQGLYLDKWIEMAARAWRQGVVDGAAPVVRAVEDWLMDIRGIITEPIHPLAVVLSHHWNRTVDVMNKHGMSIDRKLWGHLNSMADRAINFGHGKAVLKHLNDLREAVDVLIAKSGQEVELLVKEMVLGWQK